jgi:hypothetical protein
VELIPPFSQLQGKIKLSKQRTIQVSGLNIAMHSPHSPQRYVELFNQAMQTKRPLRKGDVHMLMLGSVRPDNPEKPEDGLHGEIYRFVKLNPNEPWFNELTHDVATEDDLREVNIPQNLLPHLKRFPFVFNPKTHHLYYIKSDRTNSIGPAAIKDLLDHLISPLVIDGKFPETNITIIPETDSIDRILGLQSIEQLTIEITRPNPDDGDSVQQRWMNRLANQKVKKIVMNMQSSKGESIQPDGDTKAMAEVAAMDGKVVAIGYNSDGDKVIESTVEQNMVKYVSVDSDTETAELVLSRTAIDLDANFT